MKNAFNPEAVISLLANENRVTNGALSECYSLHYYHYSSALINNTKVFIPFGGNLHKTKTDKKQYLNGQMPRVFIY